MRSNDDPGWRLSMRSRLAVLRMLFVACFVELGVLAVVTLFVAVPDHDAGTPAAWPWIMLGVGIVGTGAAVAVQQLTQRPLSCDDLAASYRSRIILCLAIAESVALLGFAGAVAAKTTLVYTLLGLPLSVACLAVFAPTKANIERDHERLRAAGCAGSLYEALS